MDEARQRDETLKNLPQGKTQAGSFSILNGTFVNPDEEEYPLFSTGKRSDDQGFPVIDQDDPDRNVVQSDNLIIQNSLCVGFDCVAGENFSFDTIRMKENNLRVKFIDTSSSTGFPTNDWTLIANDSANGGANYFAIENFSADRKPFVIDASAGADSIHVKSTGVGFGTSTPMLELHVKSSNSPTLRLDQDNSGGFASQTWDIGGNETNFFVRDVTFGNTLPFRIRAAAPNFSFFIAGDGDVGLGTGTPDAKLDVEGTAIIRGATQVLGDTSITGSISTTTGATIGGDASVTGKTTSGSLEVTGTSTMGDDVTISGNGAGLVISDTTGSTGNRNLISLTNQGNTKILFDNTADSGSGSSTAQPWELVYGNNGQMYFFQQGQTNGSGNALRALDIYGDGQIFVAGTLTHGSDVNIKENIEAIEPMAVLDQVLDLPISTWNYKTNCADVKHMGPMAQDFFGIFGLNNSDTGISSTDTSGVALGAIQGLNNKLMMEVASKDAEIAELRNQLKSQEARFQEQEARFTDQEARLRAIEAALLK